MSEFSNDEVERRKQAIFDSMSARRQRHILKRGYEKWDPFEAPNDPIDIRRERTNRTTRMLVQEFLQSRPQQGYSNAYGRGVLEMALGIINNDERFIGMFEFACWYRSVLEAEGHHPPE